MSTNEVKIRYVVQDDATAPAKSIAGSLKQVNNQIENQAAASQKAASKSSSAVDQLTKRFISISAAIMIAQKSVKLVVDTLKEFDKQSGGNAVTKLQQQFGQLQMEIGSVLYPELLKFTKWFEENKQTITAWGQGITKIVVSVVKLFVTSVDIIVNSVKMIVYGVADLYTWLLKELIGKARGLANKLPIGEGLKKSIGDAYQYMGAVQDEFHTAAQQTAEDLGKGYKAFGTEVTKIAKAVSDIANNKSTASGVVHISEKDAENARKLAEALEKARVGIVDLKKVIGRIYDTKDLNEFDKKLYDIGATYDDLKYKAELAVEAVKAAGGLVSFRDLLLLYGSIDDIRLSEIKKVQTDHYREMNQIQLDELKVGYELNKEYSSLNLTELENYYASVIAVMIATGDDLTAITAEQNKERNALIKNLESEYQAGVTPSGTSPKSSRSSSLAALDKETERRRQILINLTDSQMYTEEELSNYLISLDQYTANERLRIDQEYTNAKLNNMQTQVLKAADLAYMITDIANTMTDTQLNNLAKETEARYEALDVAFKADTKFTKNKGKLEKQYADEKEKIQKEQEAKEKEFRNKQKGWSIAQASISGAEAIMNAWVQAMKLPSPVNMIMGSTLTALITASTAAQIANIESQKFAKGGIVDGPRTGDQVQANVNGGEMILTNQQQAALWGKLSSGSYGSSSNISIGGDTIVVQGNMDKDAADRLIRNRNERMKLLKDDIRELSYRGQLAYA